MSSIISESTARTHQPWCVAHEYGEVVIENDGVLREWGFCVRPLRDAGGCHVEINDGGLSGGPEVEVCWDGESLTVDKARTLAQSILVACELLESEARG